MNTFEAAKAKYEKNRITHGRDYPKTEIDFVVKHEVSVTDPVVEVKPTVIEPIEKSADAIIKVTVSLPTKDIVFTLRKRNVLSNVSASRMTKDEFRNAFMRGLEPLLGRVEPE